ncbi:LysR family transcriptional regulator [Klebsiella pneumoniae]|uniref:LysR family transcriptional regulator n=1 Tax=Klebsiella pneumoniae TaxID=573 RepID=A0A447RJ83_KLEPN|nr:LysR family transcriptional regulator [Klebsiella pneumoniae]
MAKRENYNDLYLFMQVVREGSFTAAAQRLGLAQSGVSRAVRELEERLGVQLLVRTTRPVVAHSGRVSSSITTSNPVSTP